MMSLLVESSLLLVVSLLPPSPALMPDPVWHPAERLGTTAVTLVPEVADPSLQDSGPDDSERVDSASSLPPLPTEENFFRDLLKDQKAVWTSPTRIRKKDLGWLVALGLATTTLIPTDRHIADDLRDRGIRGVSRSISSFGGPANFITSSAIYGVGKLSHNQRMQETGLQSLRAVGASWVAVQGLKLAFNRERPNMDDQKGRFWAGGSSFPSGHSASTWAMATVIANQYSDKKALQIGAYGFATLISLSRLTGQKHFASDILVGSAIGYLIGRYIFKAR